MEALADADDKDADFDAGKTGGSSFEPQMANTVVYQLVRVEGDGRLIPATDDEVIEVEHLLEDNKNQLLSVEGPSHYGGCVSDEVLFSRKSDLEGSKGLWRSKNIGFDSRKLNARVENIEVILQKVKQEERLRLSDGSGRSFLNYMDVDGQSSVCPTNSRSSSDKFHSQNTLLETAHHPTSLNGGIIVQSECVAASAESSTDLFARRSAVSELLGSRSIKPEFSVLKGGICLSGLTVSELQEVYKATFRCETSVKDKSWLKRRIAIGLSNSCSVPMPNIVIKEETRVQNSVKEESLSRSIRSGFKAAAPSTVEIDRLTNDDLCLESSPSSVKQKKTPPILSDKRLRTVEGSDVKGVSFHLEQIAAKRIKKPTRRYIEELSEVDPSECINTLSCSVNDTRHGQSSPISSIRPVRSISSHGATVVTRQDSLGGSHIKIPYVSRVRRGRPRKNFMALMNIVGMDGRTTGMETPHGEEEHGSCGDALDENIGSVLALKSGGRRKHHRAWTLCEVMKLVEGVARYGTGRWSEIKRLAFASHAHRTSVDLKDKWRNLLRASSAQGPGEKGVRKNAPLIPIPSSILLRVRELAEMDSQPGPIKVGGHCGRRIVGDKGCGFL